MVSVPHEDEEKCMSNSETLAMSVIFENDTFFLEQLIIK